MPTFSAEMKIIESTNAGRNVLATLTPRFAVAGTQFGTQSLSSTKPLTLPAVTGFFLMITQVPVTMLIETNLDAITYNAYTFNVNQMWGGDLFAAQITLTPTVEGTYDIRYFLATPPS